jgi:hypothetical protein
LAQLKAGLEHIFFGLEGLFRKSPDIGLSVAGITLTHYEWRTIFGRNHVQAERTLPGE